MKSSRALVLTAFGLILSVLACQLPPGSTQPPPETVTTEIETISPTETSTLAPTITNTPTLTPTATLTEASTSPLPIFSSPILFNFSMFTSTEGWAVTRDEDHLLRTIDGGETWLDATPSGLDVLPSGYTTLGIRPFFLDAMTAWFTPNSTGGGMLYRTQDGGGAWTSNPLPFDRAGYFFVDFNLGFALVDLGAGAGSHYVAIHRTEDGGATWTEVFTHEPGESKSLREGGSKNGVTFLDVDHGWIGGNIPMEDHFYLYYTEDGGTNWALETDISLPSAYAGSWLNVEQPFFVTSTSGYLPVRAMAPDDNKYLLIYRSDDSGATWTFQNGVQDGRLVDFYSFNEGYIAASTELYRTVDGGLTWTPVTSPGIPVGEFFLNVDFVNDQHGWALTTPDDSTWEPLYFYRTTDGGMSWVQLLP